MAVSLFASLMRGSFLPGVATSSLHNNPKGEPFASAPYIRLCPRKVAQEAQYRCGYCLTSQLTTAMPMHLEHIIPLAAGGTSDEENLWLACPLCNGSKGSRVQATDPETGEETALFNPRRQVWSEHFQWSKDGIEILGLTPCGRATVVALKLNNENLIRARRRWVLAGWHPPER